MAATLLFKERITHVLKDGRRVVVFMDLWTIEPPDEGLLESKFKLSWIAFDEAVPGKRILMDCHKPIGLHLHIEDGSQIRVAAKTLDDAFDIFRGKIFEYFGEELEV